MDISEDVLTIVKKDLPFKWEVRQNSVLHSAYFAKDIVEFDKHVDSLLDIFRVLSYDGVDCTQFFDADLGGVFATTYFELFSGSEPSVVASKINSEQSLNEIASAIVWDNRGFDLQRYDGVENDYIFRLMCMLLMHERDTNNIYSSIKVLSNDGRLRECGELLKLLNMKNIAVNENFLHRCLKSSCFDTRREALAYALRNDILPASGLYDDCDYYDILNDELIFLVVANNKIDVISDALKKLSPNESLYYSYIGALGDTSSIDFLIDVISRETVISKYASEAFLMITGMDYLDEDATLNDVHLLREDDDYSALLPLLDASYIKSWWYSNKHYFETSQRYLMGEKLSEPNFERIKSSGNQKQRLIADIALQSINSNYIRRPLNYNHAREVCS